MTRRGQANLPALALALLVVTTTAGLAFSLADSAFTDATRDPTDRRLAVGIAERLVSPETPLTDRAGVVKTGVLANLTASELASMVPATEGVAIRLRVGDRTIVERGDTTDGATARRIVLLADSQPVTRTPALPNNRTTLPRRTDEIRLDIDPPNGTRVSTVRANGRVVLRDPSGLDDAYNVSVSRFETTTLTFETDGPLAPGDVTVTYTPRRTTKATLEVTVDA